MLRRPFLGKGDRGGSATIIEGLDSVTCSNPPPLVHIATLGMKTYCTACKSEGVIAPSGPRHPGTGPNGEGWALSGDINLCGCSPAPVFRAERNMAQIFTGYEAGRHEGHGVSSAVVPDSGNHWILFSLRESGSVGGLRCVAYFADGSKQRGTFSINNTVRFERNENGSNCSHIEFHFTENANSLDSVTELLLTSITG